MMKELITRSEENKTAVKKFHCIDKRCKFPFTDKEKHQKLHGQEHKNTANFIECRKPQGKTCKGCEIDRT